VEGGIHPAPGFSPATGGAEAPRGLKAVLRVAKYQAATGVPSGPGAVEAGTPPADFCFN
jgi:hypothetical protein